jgi:hypothetical protein
MWRKSITFSFYIFFFVLDSITFRFGYFNKASSTAAEAYSPCLTDVCLCRNNYVVGVTCSDSQSNKPRHSRTTIVRSLCRISNRSGDENCNINFDQSINLTKKYAQSCTAGCLGIILMIPLDLWPCSSQDYCRVALSFATLLLRQ